MTVKDIFNPSGWKKNTLKKTIIASTKKYLESRASVIHNTINNINKVLLKDSYSVKTVLIESKKKTHYTLKVEIKYHGNKKKYKHKKNSHRQRNSI